MKSQTLGSEIDPAALSTLFLSYVAVNSESGTAKEKLAAEFVVSALRGLPYFIKHPRLLALEPVPGDHLQRSIAWALAKGKGSRTVVLIHHLDVVEVEDFGLFKHLAFDPAALEKALAEDPSGLDADARADLASGRWAFGRGSADMKAGGAIQLSALAACTEAENMPGNVLLLAVPDEERLSAGMRAASTLLSTLRERHCLEYVLMINSEPHQRKVSDKGLLSGGSIGKMLPFVYARGILAHAGKSYEGFNPLALLGDIISRSEMCPGLTDIDERSGESAPPPTWLMARDGKAAYDVSMPLGAFGCLSVLFLRSGPRQVLDSLLEISRECAAAVASRVNDSIDRYRAAAGRSDARCKWAPVVQSFSEFIEGARKADPGRFDRYYDEALIRVRGMLRDGSASYAGATRDLIEAIFLYCPIDQPRVIVGLVPPYYPSVSYRDRSGFESIIKELAAELNEYSKDRFAQDYELESYFTGISDLSYSSLGSMEALDLEKCMDGHMPLYGESYAIPFADIERSAMPCINIGPWGKDFHKLSERVLKEDAFSRTPALVLRAIEYALGPAARRL